VAEHPIQWVQRGADPANPPQAHSSGPSRFTALPPLSLYVHVPWCLRKCPYCDFNSHERQASTVASIDDGSLYERYGQALMCDLEAALPAVWGRRVGTVFIGGGTPSLMPPPWIEELIAGVRARLPLEPGAEITMEANPGTFEVERFANYRRAGVTRLSIGVQSFNDKHLLALGRVHDANQAKRAVAEAASVFETFNLDLMYALPGQSLNELQHDLDEALRFDPPHLSVYHLTLEPNTMFHANPPKDLPDPDVASDMLDAIIEGAARAGLSRYEVSAFAKEGHRCAHNLNYWQFGDYLGIGAGAHGKLSFPDRIVRETRWRDPVTFMDKALQGNAVSNLHVLEDRQLPFEFMLNALRVRDGVPASLVHERTGLSWVTLMPTLEKAVQRGLLEPVDGAVLPHLRATPRGYDFLTDLQSMFLPS
jgi:putative oxygen-independent coproporphyrinogen III oxidase